MRPDAGPIHPNPEAIVLISTCFQQQYGCEDSLWTSNIKSERIIPKLIICFINKYKYNYSPQIIDFYGDIYIIMLPVSQSIAD